MSGIYYDFSSVREQIIQAKLSGLCTFSFHPLFESQTTKINEDTWAPVCRERLCTKMWCEIKLDIFVPNQRTRSISVYYFLKGAGKHNIYVSLYGTIFGELKKNKIIDPDRLKKLGNIDESFMR